MKLTWKTYQSGASLDLMGKKGSCVAIRFHWTIVEFAVGVEFRGRYNAWLSLGVVSLRVWL